jgi:hypothetical protein
MNRRLLKRWAEQDERGLRLQKSLFSADHDSEPTTPIKEPFSDRYSTCDQTFQIQAEDETSTPIDQISVDRAIISRMVAGSSRSRTVSATDISDITFSTINIHKEFSDVYDQKKNKCAGILSFIQWLKKHEHFKWPAEETGDALRDVLSALATNLVAEFLAPPKLVAAIQMAALYVSKFHRRSFISDFHAGLCYQDSDFEVFQQLCAHGNSDDSVLKFVQPSLLPGYLRLTGADSAEYWVETATALIDSAAFLDIIRLEEAYNNHLNRWRGFKIGSQDPKLARSTEQEMFSALLTSSERAGLTTIDSAERASHLIQGISLKIVLHGNAVTVQSVIQDAIATSKLGRAAVTRKFVFDQYQEHYEFNAHHASIQNETKVKPPPSTPRIVQGSGGAQIADLGAADDLKLECRDCKATFVFTVGEQMFYKDKNMASQPSRCQSCNKTNKEKMSAYTCADFKKKGSCAFGDKCRFKHEDPMVLCTEAIDEDDSDGDSEEEWSRV